MTLSDAGLATIFTAARTHHAWQPTTVAPGLLGEVYDVAKLGPTSANCSPMRVGFVCGADAKERLLTALSRGNRAKAQGAAAIAIVAQDRDYLDKVPELYPVGYDARSWFTSTETSADDHGLRNTMLQAAYLIIAARALGLDCGPMSGFDPAAVDRMFFPDGRWTARLLVNMGRGAEIAAPARRLRLSSRDACRFF